METVHDTESFTKEEIERELMAPADEEPHLYPPELQEVCLNTHLPLLEREQLIRKIGQNAYTLTKDGHKFDIGQVAA